MSVRVRVRAATSRRYRHSPFPFAPHDPLGEGDDDAVPVDDGDDADDNQQTVMS